GREDGGRGWVTHGGNRGAVEVDGIGWEGGVREREGSVVGSKEVIDGIGGMGGKKVTCTGRGCVG
ncbi:hypothetical protein KI387_044530, partial [Taxus chinensis]